LVDDAVDEGGPDDAVEGDDGEIFLERKNGVFGAPAFGEDDPHAQSPRACMPPRQFAEVHTVRVFDHDADELLVKTLMSVSTFLALTTTAVYDPNEEGAA
jgi:hypothetical protein